MAPHTWGLTLQQKKILCNYAEQNPGKTQAHYADWARETFRIPYPPSQSTISRIIKRRSDYAALASNGRGLKRQRAPNHPELENALANWVFQGQDQRIALSGDIVKAKAAVFAEKLGIVDPPAFSTGWLGGFKARYNFHRFKVERERGSEAPLSDDELNQIRRTIERYPLGDRYSLHQTGLFYSLAPDKNIAQSQIENVGKSKARLNCVLMCNQTGTYRDLMIIGHARQPRCFKDKKGSDYGFYYRSNKKAWLTSLLFQEYVRKLDAAVDHNVLLLVDGGLYGLGDWEPEHVKILYLARNTTTNFQPFNAGIFQNFKAYYRKRQLEYAVEAELDGLDPYYVNQLTAMQWIRAAWDSVLPHTIENCWRRTGLIREQPRANPQERETFYEVGFQIGRLNIPRATPIFNFLNPIEEQHIYPQPLTDEQLIEAAIEQDHDDDQDQAERMLPAAALPLNERMAAVRWTLRALDTAEGYEGTAEGVRKFYRGLVEQAERERSDSLLQRQTLSQAAVANHPAS